METGKWQRLNGSIFDFFPIEIIQYIMHFLDKNDLLNLSLANRRIEVLVLDYIKRNNIIFTFNTKRLRNMQYSKHIELPIEVETLIYQLSQKLYLSVDLTNFVIRNVSKLCHVHTLNLTCTRVTDVSALGNIHTLKLKGTHVTDVSALGNVKNLEMYFY